MFSEPGLLLSSLCLHISSSIREKITIKETGVTEGARRATGVTPSARCDPLPNLFSRLIVHSTFNRGEYRLAQPWYLRVLKGSNLASSGLRRLLGVKMLELKVDIIALKAQMIISPHSPKQLT